MARTTGSKNKKKKDYVKIGTTISPENQNWLLSLKARGFKVNEIIDSAVSAWKKSNQGNDPAIAAIEFMLSPDCECPMDFLRCWNEGDFDTIRNEWPEAPETVFLGA